MKKLFLICFLSNILQAMDTEAGPVITVHVDLTHMTNTAEWKDAVAKKDALEAIYKNQMKECYEYIKSYNEKYKDGVVDPKSHAIRKFIPVDTLELCHKEGSLVKKEIIISKSEILRDNDQLSNVHDKLYDLIGKRDDLNDKFLKDMQLFSQKMFSMAEQIGSEMFPNDPVKVVSKDIFEADSTYKLAIDITSMTIKKLDEEFKG